MLYIYIYICYIYICVYICYIISKTGSVPCQLLQICQWSHGKSCTKTHNVWLEHQNWYEVIHGTQGAQIPQE